MALGRAEIRSEHSWIAATLKPIWPAGSMKRVPRTWPMESNQLLSFWTPRVESSARWASSPWVWR